MYVGIHRLIFLAENLGMIRVRADALYTEKNGVLQGKNIRIIARV